MTELATLFEQFENDGPAGLARPDAERLAHLIQSDPRCCAALPKSFQSRRSRTRFRAVLTAAWIDEEYAEVFDYRRKLLRSAGRHRRYHAPLVALILYAVWIEHTVNAIVISAARINSRQIADVDAMARKIVETKFPDRVSRLWAQHRAPAIDRTMRSRLCRFMELRNDLVHYKWIGRRPGDLQNDLDHMRTLVQSAPSLVVSLRRIERQVTTAKFRPRIRELLGLSSTRRSAA